MEYLQDNTAVFIYPDDDVFVHSMTTYLLSRLLFLSDKYQYFSLVLTGGRIMSKIIDALSKTDNPIFDKIKWNNCYLFWSDDRFCNINSDDRNDIVFKNNLLNRLNLKSDDKIFYLPFTQSQSIINATNEYNNKINDYIELMKKYELPIFNICILSLGPDGHIASLFPNKYNLNDKHYVSYIEDAPKKPSERISLTINSINLSNEVWILATGDEKKDAVKLALYGDDKHDIPAQHVKGIDKTLWFLDKESANLI